jgi:hypothetical protein
MLKPQVRGFDPALVDPSIQVRSCGFAWRQRIGLPFSDSGTVRGYREGIRSFGVFRFAGLAGGHRSAGKNRIFGSFEFVLGYGKDLRSGRNSSYSGVSR